MSKNFLITRLPPYAGHFYDSILKWVARNAPEVAPLFTLIPYPFEVEDLSPYGLHVPWLQDPVQYYNMPAFEASCRLSKRCDDLGIPIINRVEKLANAGKTLGSAIIRQAGFRTPQMALIADQTHFRETLLGFDPPFFIREDWSHNSEFFLIENVDQVKDIPWENYRRPTVCEFIDVRTPADVYHRNRCFVIGDLCLTQSIHICDHWKSKGDSRVNTAETREIDLAYSTGKEPHAAQFLKAASLLELQWLAFDYAIHPTTGEIIVWEANPYPYLDFSGAGRAYLQFVVDRTLAAVVRLYLRTAGIEVPRRVERLALSEGD